MNVFGRYAAYQLLQALLSVLRDSMPDIDLLTLPKMQMLGHDTYPPADMTCVLGRTNFTGLTAAMASVVSDLGGNVWQTISISVPIVDNDTHAYWVRVKMGGGTPEFEHRIYAIKITSPLP